MTFRPRKLLELFCAGLTLAIVFLSLNCEADGVVLHLRNGDRIAGTILSETTNQITLSNVWTPSLVIPISQIERRELLTNTSALAAGTNSATTNLAATNAPAPPATVAQTNAPSSTTNGPPLAKAASPPVTVPPPPPPKLPWYKHWKGDILFGTTLIRGATDTELYYGKGTFTYSHAYDSDPQQFFRNIFTFVGDYGKSAGVLSANDASASSKTDFDTGKRTYVYNLGAVGYDKIRLIDLHYEEGPGMGYHLFKGTNFVANTEVGANYQVDERSDDTRVESAFFRLAEDFNWKIAKNLTLVEKYEFFPRYDGKEYRWRFESTLSYAFLTNVSFNLGIVDFYDTLPAAGVPHNDFELRSALGVKF